MKDTNLNFKERLTDELNYRGLSNKEFAQKTGGAVNDVKVLHHHERVNAHALRHVERDDAVADVPPVSVGYDGAAHVRLGDSLLHLK